MKKYSFIIGLVVILAIVAWAAVATFSSKIVGTNIKYCGSNGKLTNTKPIQSHRSYCVSATHDETMAVGTPNKYVFSIVDDQGEKLKDFETVHEKIMHVIVVRKDLAEFQHVHPDFDTAARRFAFTNLGFPSDGEYRIFSDFTPKGGQMGSDGKSLGVTIYEDVAVGDINRYTAKALGAETREDTVGAYSVSLETPASVQSDSEQHLTLTVKKDGKSVADLKPYLGAYGHVVVLRDGTLDFLHAHPMDKAAPKNGGVGFMTTFTQPGKYKVFGQFQTAEELLTADFIVNVAQGAAETSNTDMDGMTDMPGMAH